MVYCTRMRERRISRVSVNNIHSLLNSLVERADVQNFSLGAPFFMNRASMGLCMVTSSTNMKKWAASRYSGCPKTN